LGKLQGVERDRGHEPTTPPNKDWVNGVVTPSHLAPRAPLR
jgi:hypothetical protein